MVDLFSINPSASRDPERSIMTRAYRGWAPFYDAVCGGLFAPSRRKLVSLASASGRSVLEIGVGTGLSLKDYAAGNIITGIDASDEMIARARMRADEGTAARIKALEIMDAGALDFDDDGFDVVVAQFLITLVPDPETVLDEAYRVLRRGGRLFLLNHFRSKNRLVAGLETRMAPFMHHFGLRPDFPFERVQNWARQKQDILSLSRMACGPFGCFSIIVIEKGKSSIRTEP